jgi:hypothetical protein
MCLTVESKTDISLGVLYWQSCTLEIYLDILQDLATAANLERKILLELLVRCGFTRVIPRETLDNRSSACLA